MFYFSTYLQTTKVKSGVGFARTLADLLVPVPFCVITLETEEVSLLFSVAICCTDIFGFAVQRVPCVLTFFFDFFFNIKRTASFFSESLWYAVSTNHSHEDVRDETGILYTHLTEKQ